MKQPPGQRLRFAAAGLTPVVKWLLVVTVASFVIFLFSGKAIQAQIARWLVLTPGALLDGHVWKLATTVLLPDGPVALFFDVLVLWLFMPFLERAWGSRWFLRFGAIATLVAYLVSSLVGIAIGGPALGVNIGGLTPFIYAGIIGYGVDYAEQPLQFFGVIPMKGKTLAIGMAVVVVIATLFNRSFVTGAGHIAAMLTGFLMTTRSFTPRLWILKWRHARLKRRFKVLGGGVSGESSSKKWIN
jgi:membrane associated rhomboid family serine protease